MAKSIRTDKWPLKVTSGQREQMAETIGAYRRYCRALSVIILNNWPALQQAPSFAAAVERLMHPTSKNPNPRHHYFDHQHYKFPSYLRRAAINFVQGQVSSYLTRYNAWLSGNRKHRHSKPPRFNPSAGCYPALYNGQMVRFTQDNPSVQIKLWNGKEWRWSVVAVHRTGNRHKAGEIKSPSLILNARSCHLSVPVELNNTIVSTSRVCSVDMGINTTATMTVVDERGTVVAREFFHPAADIDRRNRQLGHIRRAASHTKKLSKGFCRTHYRKARHYNRQISHITSRAIVDFAKRYGADTIVMEYLKGWRPKAGKKRSLLKEKFHGWLKSAIADLTSMKFKELGGKVRYVYARGTSRFAYDGSGPVKRTGTNYALATFTTGKQYNCDLSACYNIAARHLAMALQRVSGNKNPCSQGKSSCGQPRIPVTLSTLWGWEHEAAFHA